MFKSISMRLAGLMVLGATALGAGSASADPVLYRVSTLNGDAFLNSLPAPVHPPITNPSPRVASVMTNATQPASVQFNSGDLVYSNRFFNPSPPTAYGVFYSSQGWEVSNKAGTLGPNTAAGPITFTVDGFPSNPPNFSSTGPQPTQGLIRVTPGGAKFGGSWDLGARIDSFQVFAQVAGGFTAGFVDQKLAWGAIPTFTASTSIGFHHPTTNVASPVFSTTAGPTTPTTCPWAGSLIPFQAEKTAVRWTTGMVTARHALPPLTLLPPTGTVVSTGADNRTGPMSSMGTLQLVTPYLSHIRGALNAESPQKWNLVLTFLPEPSAELRVFDPEGVVQPRLIDAKRTGREVLAYMAADGELDAPRWVCVRDSRASCWRRRDGSRSDVGGPTLGGEVSSLHPAEGSLALVSLGRAGRRRFATRSRVRGWERRSALQRALVWPPE